MKTSAATAFESRPEHRCIDFGTTLDIDAPILKDLELLGKRERKSLGQLASELLAEALSQRRGRSTPPPTFCASFESNPRGGASSMAMSSPPARTPWS